MPRLYKFLPARHASQGEAGGPARRSFSEGGCNLS